MMGQLHIVAAIVRFEFTLTEFLKSHIHVCLHVLTDVCSLSILIVFLFSPLHPSCCASLSHNLFHMKQRKNVRSIYYYLRSSWFFLMIVKSKRFFLWFLEIQDNDDNKDDFLRESESHDSPFLFWSLCGTKRNSFIKSKEGTFFSGGRGEIWLIVDPGLGPRRFHVIVGEGGKTWIRGGLFFFLLHAHTHRHVRIHIRRWSGRMTSEWQDNEPGLMHANALWRFNMDGKRSALSMHRKYLISNFSPPRKRFDKGSNSFTFGKRSFVRSSIETADSCLDRSVITEIRSEMALPELQTRYAIRLIILGSFFKRNGNILGKKYGISNNVQLLFLS